METSTTIKQMLAGNRIFVPTYQKAYSWETEVEKSNSSKQTNVFLSGLEDYNKSSTTSPYYFGRFLFTETDKRTFAVTVGKQRLTTIVIFLSALFSRLGQIRPLNETELETFEDIIKKNQYIVLKQLITTNNFLKIMSLTKSRKIKKDLKRNRQNDL